MAVDPRPVIFTFAMFGTLEETTPPADAPEFARVQVETTAPASAFQTPHRNREGDHDRSIVLGSPTKCESLTGVSCPVGELVVFQSTNQVVVSCGCSKVPADFFPNLCAAVTAEAAEIPVFYDIDPRWPAVWAVALQISHVHHKLVTPCTLQWEVPDSTGFANFF